MPDNPSDMATPPQRPGAAWNALARASGWRAVFIFMLATWSGALLYAAVAGRSLFADGAFGLLTLLQRPRTFFEYDLQRSFASFIIQAPILVGQRLGLDTVGAYAALYSIGLNIVPAAALLAALYVSRRQPALFLINAAAVTVFGFGANYMPSEANLLTAFVVLAATLIALDREAPLLRGIGLLVLAFALLRVYEGMLLAGPILAFAAFYGVGAARSERERLGLTIAGFLFLLATVTSLASALAPRDPGNASNFAASAFLYLRNPQALLLAGSLLAILAAVVRGPRAALACAGLAFACGAAFLLLVVRMQGYYAYLSYYENRSFMTLFLPVWIAAMFALLHLRPAWLREPPAGRYAALLIPFAFAVTADYLGTLRWSRYVGAFCAALNEDATPAQRLARVQQSGALTAWMWTHPTMSLLRRNSSNAMVTNEPGRTGWEPFDPTKGVPIAQKGMCQAPLLGKAERDSFTVPISFANRFYPSYVASIRGISQPEGWGTWSEGPEVQVRFVEKLPRSFDLAIRLGTAFGSNRSLPVKVRAGRQEHSFVPDREPFEATIEFRDIGEADTITFVIPRPESPKDLGQSADARLLGIGLVSLGITPR